MLDNTQARSNILQVIIQTGLLTLIFAGLDMLLYLLSVRQYYPIYHKYPLICSLIQLCIAQRHVRLLVPKYSDAGQYANCIILISFQVSPFEHRYVQIVFLLLLEHFELSAGMGI